jgi:hypothetical protein
MTSHQLAAEPHELAIMELLGDITAHRCSAKLVGEHRSTPGFVVWNFASVR